MSASGPRPEEEKETPHPLRTSSSSLPWLPSARRRSIDGGKLEADEAAPTEQLTDVLDIQGSLLLFRNFIYDLTLWKKFNLNSTGTYQRELPAGVYRIHFGLRLSVQGENGNPFNIYVNQAAPETLAFSYNMRLDASQKEMAIRRICEMAKQFAPDAKFDLQHSYAKIKEQVKSTLESLSVESTSIQTRRPR